MELEQERATAPPGQARADPAWGPGVQGPIRGQDARGPASALALEQVPGEPVQAEGREPGLAQARGQARGQALDGRAPAGERERASGPPWVRGERVALGVELSGPAAAARDRA